MREARRLPRFWWLPIPLILLNISAASAVIYLGHQAHTVSVGEAVRRFRAQSEAPVTTTTLTNGVAPVITSTTAAPTPQGSQRAVRSAGSQAAPTAQASAPAARRESLNRPAPGVYVYATDGEEETDALGGTKRSYPSQTTITVTQTDCGVLTRWDALSERWDEQYTCYAPNSITVPRAVNYHEFFTVGQTRDYTCDSGSFLRPPNIASGQRWQYGCTGGAQTAVNAAVVVNAETLIVGGTPVDTVHVHYDQTIGGDASGGGTYDTWTAKANGLVVKRNVSVKVRSDSPTGKVNYQERYALTLLSLVPRS